VTDLVISEAEAAFHREHPGYADTAVLDDPRATDFARLDRDGHVYLDYTGGGMFGSSQVAQLIELLESGVFGNPHSINPTSAASSELVERARAYVLEFFRGSPQEYEAIFTPNATGALRLVGEAYPFRPGDRFLLTFDNHNSVNGIREFARTRGADTTYIPSVAPDLRVDESMFPRYLTDTIGDHHNLFAYPAQSNFSGVQHPLEWIEQAHAHGWDVLLDAAAYVPTSTLDLRIWHPDFVAISFYKMFGWPTGVGCLLARVLSLGAGRRTLRGRHRQLPEPAGRRNRAAISRPRRHRHDPSARRRARRVADPAARFDAARERHARDDDLRTAVVAAARCHDRVQLPPSRREDRRRAIRRPNRVGAQRFASHRLLLQPRGG
jgi:Aminotransferase class-V